jgi:predicted dehydrogenase
MNPLSPPARASSVSRRNFIARSAATFAAAGVGSQLGATSLAADAPPAPADRKLGYAFVGLGSLCMNQLLPGIAKCKHARPVALVSGHPDKAKQQTEKYGINPKNIYNYENFDSIKDNPEIDVVYVVLPNSMHAEYTVRAAKAGKHVQCEKPMAVSVAECQQMIDACKAAGRKLAIGYRLHYEPNTLACIKAIKDQEAGKIQIIEAGAGFSIGDPAQWRLKKALSGGGCLMDIGIYALQAARYLSGEEPIEVTAQTFADRQDPRFKEVEQHCNFQLRFPSGVLASCVSSYATGLNRFVAHTTKGSATLDPALSYNGVKFHIQRPGQPEESPNLPDIDQFAAEIDAFAQCILTNTPSQTPGEEGLRDVRIMQGIYESAETGKAVKL